MHALNPAMAHEPALLLYALAALVKAIWPNGIGRQARRPAALLAAGLLWINQEIRTARFSSKISEF